MPEPTRSLAYLPAGHLGGDVFYVPHNRELIPGPTFAQYTFTEEEVRRIIMHVRRLRTEDDVLGVELACEQEPLWLVAHGNGRSEQLMGGEDLPVNGDGVPIPQANISHFTPFDHPHLLSATFLVDQTNIYLRVKSEAQDELCVAYLASVEVKALQTGIPLPPKAHGSA